MKTPAQPKSRRHAIFRWALVLLGLAGAAALALVVFLPKLNDYQVDGEISTGGATAPGLSSPVQVVRDEQGMAYLRAETWDDLIFAQGFVTAQDRLFSMELTRRFAQGTLSEMAGERALNLDIRQRTIGFRRLAEQHAELLDGDTRRMFQRYVDGVNAYVELRPETHPIEFRLAGLEPTPWTITDSLSVLYLMAWNSSANLKHEIITQMLIDAVGEERAASLAPININPDLPPGSPPGVRGVPGDALGDPSEVENGSDSDSDPSGEQIAAVGNLGFVNDPSLQLLALDGPLQLGSNNWAVAGHRSPGGKPILAGDPHLDPRVLPGVWHPIGLQSPDLRAVGVAVPGIPGLTLMRTSHVAVAVTNAYGDAQDLFVESLDPEDPSRYLSPDGRGGCQASKPFEVRTEVVRIRDEEASKGWREHELEIRFSQHGPVVSGILAGAEGASSEAGNGPTRVVTLRWAAAEAMTPSFGFEKMLHARSVDDIDAALENLAIIGLNFVFADVDGHLGWRVSGRLPNRIGGAAGFGTVGAGMAGGRPWHVCPVTEEGNRGEELEDPSDREGELEKPSDREEKPTEGGMPAAEMLTQIATRVAPEPAPETAPEIDAEPTPETVVDVPLSAAAESGAAVPDAAVSDIAASDDTAPSGLLGPGDPWLDWIPYAEMPHARDPQRGWIGTANHWTVGPDFPYYYSTHASSSYRYRRLLELLGANDDASSVVTTEQHWAWQRDTRNLMAVALAPILAEALLAHDRTRDLGEILEAWDRHDDLDSPGALLFQELLRQLPLAMFRDELGEEVTATMLTTLYFWQERVQYLVMQGESPWFDDVSTEAVEDLPQMIRQAADAARARLEPLAGAEPSSWAWGDLHHLTFVHPLLREGRLGRWLGSGPHPMAGSAETLYRGWNNFHEPFEASHIASLRMVADLADEEKVLAILPGGVAGRTFHPHQKDQVEPFLSGEIRYWWFSESALQLHTRHRLNLLP